MIQLLLLQQEEDTYVLFFKK